jgi:hypothetical protein
LILGREIDLRLPRDEVGFVSRDDAHLDTSPKEIGFPEIVWCAFWAVEQKLENILTPWTTELSHVSPDGPLNPNATHWEPTEFAPVARPFGFRLSESSI